jgi:LysM repeat protein
MGIRYMKHLKFFIFLCILTFTVSCGQQKKYIQYKVKKGETISVIAANLSMKKKDLLRLNPDVVSEPRTNSFIVVPEKKLNNYKNKIKERPKDISDAELTEDEIIDEKVKLLEELKEKFVVYEVKKGDTFYSFKKKFNVTRGELLILNPELVEG